MRVYTSQGFKDISSPVQGGASSETPQGMQTSSASQGASQQDKYGSMRNYMLMAALSDPENASKYSTILNITKPTAYETAKAQETKEVQNITGPLNNLRQTIESGEGVGSYEGYIKFRTQKNLTSQSIAKLIEKNRLSDKDRDFYLKNFPSFWELLLAPKAAKVKIDTVEQYLNTRLGENVERAVSEEENYTPTSFISD